MKPKSPRPPKALPKARKPEPGIVYFHKLTCWPTPKQGKGTTGPYLVLPMPSFKSARSRLKFERLSYEKKVEAMAKAICDGSRNWKGARDKDAPESAKAGYRMDARAILKALTGETSP